MPNEAHERNRLVVDRILIPDSGGVPLLVGVVPPGLGICHQINLEQIAPVVWADGHLYAVDVIIGADSHTTMVNGAGSLAGL